MDLAQFWFQAPAGGGGYQVGNSLRFRGIGGQFLRRNARAGTGATSGTLSFWVKKSLIVTDPSYAPTVFAGEGSGYLCLVDFPGTNFTATGQLNIYTQSGGRKNTNAGFRDPAAWAHVVIAMTNVNSGNSTATVYINGVQDSVLTGNQYVKFWGDGTAHPLTIGNYGGAGAGSAFNGYMAEFHSVQNQTLDATSFGEFNADGVWVPIDVTGLTYGQNGFYLDFSDPADIGADRSGNGNDFTPTGFELTDVTSPLYDWTADSPTNNSPVYNPLWRSTDWAVTGIPTPTEANRNLAVNGEGGYSFGERLYPGQKYRFEVTFRSFSNGYGPSAGIGSPYIDTTYPNTWNGPYFHVYQDNDSAQAGNPNQGLTVGGQLFGSVKYFARSTPGDVLTMEFDWSNPSQIVAKVTKNGTQVLTDPSGNQTWTCTNLPADQDIRFYGVGYYRNGARGDMSSRLTGPWAYPSAGSFDGLTTANQPAVAITNPSDHFTTILDSGANILTNAQATFPNGLWWIKDRANSNQHQLVDSVRGGNTAIRCPSQGATVAYSAPAGNSVAWCWSAPDTFSSTAGTINTSGRRNSGSGFSIVTYTGNGVDNATFGHGLPGEAAFVLVKNLRPGGGNYIAAWHKDLGGDKALRLSTNDAAGTYSTALYFRPSNNTSELFGIGTNNETNTSGDNYLAYCWSEIPGYSSFGNYVGNGNADGPFVYTGFRPAFVMIKATNANDWYIFNTAVDTYNPSYKWLKPNKTGTENTGTGDSWDILSNGFKPRNSNGNQNGSGTTYIYIAFAEHPFGGSNVSPAPAR